MAANPSQHGHVSGSAQAHTVPAMQASTQEVDMGGCDDAVITPAVTPPPSTFDGSKPRDVAGSQAPAIFIPRDDSPRKIVLDSHAKFLLAEFPNLHLDYLV